MRRAIAPLAILLALATGAVLAEMRLLLPAAEVSLDAPRGEANLASVRSFYAAANQLLATGDEVPLRRIVADDFVDHTSRPGVTADRDGLVRYLRALHGSTPAVGLNVVDLAAQGDRVTAIVEVVGSRAPQGVGVPVAAGRAWGTVDVFRLRSRLIAEHWGDGCGLALVEPLLTVTIPTDSLVDWEPVAFEPRVIAAGQEERLWINGPTVLLIEAGVLRVGHDRLSVQPATVLSEDPIGHSLEPGGETLVGAGEAIVLVSRSRITIRNDGVTDAVVLGVWVGRTTAAVLGAVVAGGITDDVPENRATVTISRVALAPQAAMPRHVVANVELTIVEEGRLAVSVHGGDATFRSAPTGNNGSFAAGTLSAGEGLMVDGGASVESRSDGDAPAVFLMATLTPTSNQSHALAAEG